MDFLEKHPAVNKLGAFCELSHSENDKKLPKTGKIRGGYIALSPNGEIWN